jgi:hypothetical protein
MTRRILVSQLALTVLLGGFVSALAQDGKVKPPDCRHGLAIQYRKAGEDDFKVTQKYSAECYQEDSGNGLYISQTGGLSVLSKSVFKAGDAKSKDPLFQHGLELTVRKADGKTAKFGIECYIDENNGNLLYISETGSLGVVPAKYARPTKGKPKGAPMLHGMNLKVRKPGDKNFDKDTKKYGVDVFEDSNNGTVIYLSETGAIAVAPRDLVNKDTSAGKEPDWQHGMTLSVRAAAEKDFGKDTKRYGVEAFKDSDNGCLIYIADNGTIAVVPSKLARFPEGKSKDPESKRGMSLAVRKIDEKEFTATSKKFGVEVYQDENNGTLLYISETGGLGVAPAKEV